MAYTHLGLDGKEWLPCSQQRKDYFHEAHFITHGLFVDDMMHTTTSTKLKDEFLRKYSKDFNITGGGLMKTFLGIMMEVKQDNKTIKLHLDHYVHKMLAEYKDYIKKSLRPKCVPIFPGVILCPEDCPEVPDPL